MQRTGSVRDVLAFLSTRALPSVAPQNFSKPYAREADAVACHRYSISTSGCARHTDTQYVQVVADRSMCPVAVAATAAAGHRSASHGHRVWRIDAVERALLHVASSPSPPVPLPDGSRF